MNDTRALQRHPRFISIEGGEGAGKSTVIGAIKTLLEARGERVQLTREPGGTALAERIRALLLDSGEEPVQPATELLLMFAARAQHVQQRILPALHAGHWVLCDRFTDSSYAYQGAGRGVPQAWIEWLEQEVVALRPGLTLLLDVDVQRGRARTRQRGTAADRIEAEHDAFFQRVREGFLARAEAEPARFCVLDANQHAEAVAEAACRAVEERLP